jgi:hypothetical protein
MLYKSNVLKTICIIMLLALILISCASDPEPQENTEEEATVTNTNNNILGTQIQNVSGGLYFTFEDIPADTTAVYINVYEGEHDGKQWSDVFGIVMGPKLEEVKETKKLMCPFAKKDQAYSISIQLVINDEIVSGSEIIEMVPAEDAIYVTNTLELQLNDEQTGVTLSAEPAFSASVELQSPKYEYVLLNIINENESWSSNIYSGNELSCTFAPDTINLIKEADPELKGTFLSHVVALCNIDYEGVFWKVCVAKTEDFTLEF